MFFLYIFKTFSSIITYSSSIQIKNKYTKNRLGVFLSKNKNVFETPYIFSSRPPYNPGWLWTVEPEEDNITLSRKPVQCGSIITLINPSNEYYLSAKATSNGMEAIPVPHKHEAADQWQLICRNSTTWEQFEPIQLLNIKYKCFLSTNLEEKIPESKNEYQVKCSDLSDETIWYVSEGIFFNEKPIDPEYKDCEL